MPALHCAEPAFWTDSSGCQTLTRRSTPMHGARRDVSDGAELARPLARGCQSRAPRTQRLCSDEGRLRNPLRLWRERAPVAQCRQELRLRTMSARTTRTTQTKIGDAAQHRAGQAHRQQGRNPMALLGHFDQCAQTPSGCRLYGSACWTAVASRRFSQSYTVRILISHGGWGCPSPSHPPSSTACGMAWGSATSCEGGVVGSIVSVGRCPRPRSRHTGRGARAPSRGTPEGVRNRPLDAGARPPPRATAHGPTRPRAAARTRCSVKLY